MSCVAEAKAVMMKSSRVMVNRWMGVWPEAMTAADGCGMVSVSRMNAALISSCMARIHHRLVLMMSTNGLHSGLMVHGK